MRKEKLHEGAGWDIMLKRDYARPPRIDLFAWVPKVK